MARLVDMVAGAGWLLLALFGWQFFKAWRARTARDRAIDARIAANRQAAGLPGNRQQRRAAAAKRRKAKP